MSYNEQETISSNLELLNSEEFNSAISSEGVVNVVPEKKVCIVTKGVICAELSTVESQQNKLEHSWCLGKNKCDWTIN